MRLHKNNKLLYSKRNNQNRKATYWMRKYIQHTQGAHKTQ